MGPHLFSSFFPFCHPFASSLLLVTCVHHSGRSLILVFRLFLLSHSLPKTFSLSLCLCPLFALYPSTRCSSFSITFSSPSPSSSYSLEQHPRPHCLLRAT